MHLLNFVLALLVLNYVTQSGQSSCRAIWARTGDLVVTAAASCFVAAAVFRRHTMSLGITPVDVTCASEAKRRFGIALVYLD